MGKTFKKSAFSESLRQQQADIESNEEIQNLNIDSLEDCESKIKEKIQGKKEMENKKTFCFFLDKILVSKFKDQAKKQRISYGDMLALAMIDFLKKNEEQE